MIANNRRPSQLSLDGLLINGLQVRVLPGSPIAFNQLGALDVGCRNDAVVGTVVAVRRSSHLTTSFHCVDDFLRRIMRPKNVRADFRPAGGPISRGRATPSGSPRTRGGPHALIRICTEAKSTVRPLIDFSAITRWGACFSYHLQT